MRIIPALLLLLLVVANSCDGLEINLDWSRPIGQSSTAATVEVDVMPFLARQPATDPYIRDHHYGGSFEAYQMALARLMNASYVRFAPWCPNPRLVVPELTPPRCTATEPATNWNSTYFDQIMKDFMETVCGPDAAKGECQGRMSVIQQLSTMPSWMYHGGMSLEDVPSNPYIPTPGGHKQYEQGKSLVDTSCETMARHIGLLEGADSSNVLIGGYDGEYTPLRPAESSALIGGGRDGVYCRPGGRVVHGRRLPRRLRTLARKRAQVQVVGLVRTERGRARDQA